MQIRSRLSIGQERKDLYMALADRSSSSINQKWSNTSRPVAVATTIQQIYKKKKNKKRTVRQLIQWFIKIKKEKEWDEDGSNTFIEL